MELTRREFIKTAAVLSGAVGVGLGSGEKVLCALTELPTPVAQGQKNLVRVFCPGSGCHHKCVLWVHVVDGRITKAQAAPFPEQPEGTHCCLKGIAGVALPYYPDRLKYPMKRVGARGEGKWEQISWDEALDTIAEKLIEVRDKYGPQSVWMSTGGSSTVPSSGDVNAGAAMQRLANLLGATISTGWSIDTSPQVADFFTHGQDWDRSDPLSMLYSNLVIVWGANPAESAIRDMKYIGLARNNGATLVDIGVLFDATAAKADWWIPIRSATDAALGMSMIQVIVAEGLHDKDYLRRYTVGPLLVRDDNGLLLREADIDSGGSEENFVAWDETSNEVVIVAQGQHDVPDTLALTGTLTVKGVACRPAFQKLIDVVNDKYRPEQAAEITGVPAETIRDLAKRYALAKPAFIFTNYGVGRYYHGNLSHRAQLALAIVCGYLGELGGCVMLGGGGPNRAALNKGPVAKPTEASTSALFFDKFFQAAKTGDPYPIKMWMITYGNPIHTTPNSHRYLEEVIPNLDFIVNVNIRLDWTAQYADIVLPDATIFERMTLSGILDHVILSGPAIEPLFEARTTTWIWSELAKRIGLGEYFQHGDEDYIRMMLDSEDPTMEGITLEKLQEAEGIMRANVPREPYVALSAKYFDTPTGRLEFYSERLVPYEEELPVFKPSLEVPYSPDPQKYPLQFFTGRRRYYMQTMLGDLPVLRKFVPEPWLDINPVDAEARGIKDGDIVEVFNDRGKMAVKALVNPAVPPGAVWTFHGPGPKEYREGHYQLLTLNCYTEETFNPVHDIRWQQTRPWWKWAGGQSDTLFDCAVEVRKVLVKK